MDYTPIIGMEIHVELATASKMFCGCKNDPFHAEKPNIYTCPVCLGMPGGLPVPNKKAIEWTLALGLALGCTINTLSKFDRKNYFYPDLAKGYQISQYDIPFCVHGIVHLEGFDDVRIRRVHLEEDTGKLQHATVDGEKVTLIDFNRSGVPLVEIVTEPDIRSAQQAKAFLKKLHQIVRYLKISGADMEKGSMRLEPNISIGKQKAENGGRIEERDLPNYKVEVKNINSFNFVKKAIEYEIERQKEILEKGEIPKQETRGFVEALGSTVSQRSKETAEDYRYFPDPDIPPIVLSKDSVEILRKGLPELPDAKKERFIKAYALSDYDASLLTESIDKAEYFEGAVALSEGNDTYKEITPKMIANHIINKKTDGTTISPADLLHTIQKTIVANDICDEEIKKAVEKIISSNEKAVNDYKGGKTGVIMFLLGQVKRELQGKGDAESIKKELLKFIK